MTKRTLITLNIPMMKKSVEPKRSRKRSRSIQLHEVAILLGQEILIIKIAEGLLGIFLPANRFIIVNPLHPMLICISIYPLKFIGKVHHHILSNSTMVFAVNFSLCSYINSVLF